MPIATIIKNIIVSIKIDKTYPDIKAAGKLDSKDIKDVFSNIKALFGHQVAFTVINSADSIILSAMIGLNDLTIYNNYYYILSALTALLTIFFSSMQAGIGNSIIVDDDEIIFATFKRFRLITFMTVEIAALILFALYNPFMKIWMGESLMLNSYAVLIFVIGFFVTQIRRAVTTYKNAAGLWKPDIIKPYIVIAVDIVIDLLLVNKIGSIGAMISTIISMGLIAVPWETIVLYKNIFKRSAKEHFLFIIRECVIFAISLIVSGFTFKHINLSGCFGLIIKLLLSTIISCLLCYATHFYLDEFKWSISRLKVFAKQRS